MSELLARRDPVSLFPGMAGHRTGRAGVTAVFRAIAPKFSSTTPLSFELVSAGLSGDLAGPAGYEHPAVPVDGGPVVRNGRRVTHISRREDGVGRLVHRHGGGGPRTG
jgi:ketosteroid isomerase-like protein